MTRNPVTSSVLHSVGYSKSRKVLEIAFRHGGVYRYFGVPETVYHHLLQAESQGRFFHHSVRNGLYCFRKRK
jgi:hypothetical protein